MDLRFCRVFSFLHLGPHPSFVSIIWAHHERTPFATLWHLNSRSQRLTDLERDLTNLAPEVQSLSDCLQALWVQTQAFTPQFDCHNTALAKPSALAQPPVFFRVITSASTAECTSDRKVSWFSWFIMPFVFWHSAHFRFWALQSCLCDY